MFALSPTKTLTCHRSPTSKSKTAQHFWIIKFLGVFHPYCSTSRSTHHNNFHPLNFNQHCHQYQFPLSKNKQDLSASPANRVSLSQQISLHKSLSGLLTPKRPFSGPNRIFQKQLSAMLFSQNKNTPSKT